MDFGKDFYWGAASAAAQVEGAWNEDGKAPGIWDSLIEGHVNHWESPAVACDHYHRYKEDVALMKELGLKAYRFSVSWPRVMNAEGQVNPKGVQFYKDLVSELVNAGIEPMVTLFHWNLPMWMYDQGGWKNEKVVEMFGEYTKVVVDALSDKVKYWMTINEPACFVGLGYIMGNHAPFEKHMGDYKFFEGDYKKIIRNVLLSHGTAVKVIRENAKLKPEIGFALNGNINIPKDNTEEEIERARHNTFNPPFSDFNYALWADPIILGRPFAEMEGYLSYEDMKIISQKVDFFGVNSYYCNDYSDHFGPNPNVTPGLPRTDIGWVITPDTLYWNIRFLTDRYNLPILITENGMANVDFIMSDGKVHDPQRIEYLAWYLKGAKRAVEEGYKLIGYLHWSIMDNFEWAEGYDKRFGLIYVDYPSQKRVPKDSYYWYQNVIKTNGSQL